MNVLSQTLKRAGLLSAGILLLLQSVLPITALASTPVPGNNGTLKVHKFGSPTGEEDNEPKVCAFNFEGFGFDVGQTGYVTIEGQGQSNGVDYGPFNIFGPADENGFFATNPYFNGVGGTIIADGHYKATLYGKDANGGVNLEDEKAKSKVFKVDCVPDTTVEVVKILNPTTDPGLFNLLIEGDVEADDVGHNGTTGAVLVDPSQNISVDETPGTATLLKDYTTTVVCKDAQGVTIDSNLTPEGTSSRGLIIEADKIDVGDAIVCTITNTRITVEPVAPTLTVKKHVVNDDGGTGVVGDFDIKMNNVDLTFDAGSTVGSKTTFTATPTVVADTDYILSEVDFAGYTEGTWTCSDETSGTGLNVTVNLAAGENVTCEITNDDDEKEVLVDYCDPTKKPDGVSIAQWLARNQIDGSDCFDFEVIKECGKLDVKFTKNLTGYNYTFRYVLGETTPALADYLGNGGFPATFSEDQGGGSVKVTYYIVGPEKDYFVGFKMPNIWDGNGVTVTVDTDCEKPEPETGSISGYKLNDANGNALFDEGEEKLSGWTIQLYGECLELDVASLVRVAEIDTPEEDCYEVIAETKTDENGNYAFDDLPAGTYLVCEVQQEGWTRTFPADSDCQKVVVAEGEDCIANFANKAKTPGNVLGEVTPPKVLAKTGSPALQSLLVGLSILGAASGITALSRRKSYSVESL